MLDGLRVALTPSIFDGYSRNVLVERCLRLAGADVRDLRTAGRPDVVLARHPAHRQLARAWRKAHAAHAGLVVDPLISMLDTRIMDRREKSRYGPWAAAYWALDAAACWAGDVVLVESLAQRDYLRRLTRRATHRFMRIWTGTDEAIMRTTGLPPTAFATHPGPGVTHFVHYGNFFPLQGAHVIVSAARELRSREDVAFTLVGSGPQLSAVERAVADWDLHNVRLVGRVGYRELYEYVAGADVILGIFGESAKVDRVIPNKVFDGLSVGRAVVTADTPAVRELLPRDSFVPVPKGDAQALGAAVLRTADDCRIREQLAALGAAVFRERASARAQFADVARAVLSALERAARRRDGA